jgi:sn-glycerol 3-phosphate transport system substrate-binding protein
MQQLNQIKPLKALSWACSLKLDKFVEGAVEEALNGKKTPKDALDGAAKSINEKLATYNKTISK